MSKFYLFELPNGLLESLEPFKLPEGVLNSGFSDSDSESEPETEQFSLVETQYTTAEVEQSFERWQWENRAHITGTPYVYFTSTNPDLVAADKVLGIYKSWFSLDQLIDEPVTSVKNLPTKGKSCVIMVGSGHFAAAIIEHKRHHHKTNISNPLANVSVLKSKTFHRYTTRRKQGGAQSAMDNQKGKANSAGSTIRRANERHLQEEIKELLQSWDFDLRDCYRIFYRAPGRSNKTLISGYENAPISNDDERLVKIPFGTKRPTIDECKMTWLQLTRAVVSDPPKFDIKPVKPVATRKTKIESVAEEPEESAEEEVDESVVLTNKIVDNIKRAKFPPLQNLLTSVNNWDFKLQPEHKYVAFPTPLALAVHLNKPGVVQNLIINGASPMVKVNGLSVGEHAKRNSNQKVVEALQIARKSLGESAFDWSRAGALKGKSRDQLLAEEVDRKLKIQKENDELHAQLEREEHEKKMENLIKKHGSGKLVGGLYQASRGLSEADLKQVERERRARAAEARLAKK